MTQANNVAIESSQINSSGVLQVAGGGTGLATVGTSGYFLQSNGTGLQYAAVPATTPGGSNTQVQYNSSGTFAGSANLTWSGTALSITGSLGVSGAITTTYPSISIQPATTTSQAYVSFVNANGTYYIGNDSSTASGFGTAGNYGSVWWRPASTALAISRSSTVDLYISSNGNVGIGQSSPAYPLDVTGQARTSGLTFNYNTSLYTNDNSISNFSSSNYLYINGNTAGGTSLRSEGGANTALWLDGSTSSNGSIMRFFTASTERMRINSSGYVGIGTTSPRSYLTVNGPTSGLSISTSAGNQNIGIGYGGCFMVFLSWNNGNGYAVVIVNNTSLNNSGVILASSNSSGGNNSFDCQNSFGSNGANGISFFSNGGMNLQTKTNWSGNAYPVYINIFGM